MKKDGPISLVRSAKSFFYGTFLSRLSGLFRDMALAFYFGSNPQIAGFMVAYRFANLLRRLFGESTLQAGFIPHFEHYRAKDKSRAAHFFRDFFFSLFLILIVVIAVGEIALGLLKKQYVHDAGFNEILTLAMIMLPGLLFICLHALDSCILQCHQSYFLPAIAPLGFNFIWILAVVFVQRFAVETAMYFLSLGIVLAFFVQWLLTMQRCFYYMFNWIHPKKWLAAKIFSKEVKKLTKPLVLGILGVGAMQINSALDAIFARIADGSGPAFLWYSSRLYQLPLALFGIAISRAVLPPLSRAIENDQVQEYKRILRKAVRYSLSLMFFFTIAIFAIGASGINLIYGRGDFSNAASIETVYSLWGYCVGLIPTTLILLLANGYYAKKDYTIPTIAAILTVMLNIFLNTIFVFIFHLKAPFIALATSISSFFNFAFLFFFLSKKLSGVFNFEITLSFIKTFFSVSLSLLLAVWVSARLFADPTWLLMKGERINAFFTREFPHQLLSFFSLSILFVFCTYILAKLFRAKDLLKLLHWSRK